MPGPHRVEFDNVSTEQLVAGVRELGITVEMDAPPSTAMN